MALLQSVKKKKPKLAPVTYDNNPSDADLLRSGLAKLTAYRAGGGGEVLGASTSTPSDDELYKSGLAKLTAYRAGGGSNQPLQGAERQAMAPRYSDPAAASKFSSTVGNLNLQVNQVKNDPWVSQSQKQDKSQALVNSYTDIFAKLFKSPADIDNAMTDPRFGDSIKKFQEMGGDVNSIKAKVNSTNTAVPTGAYPESNSAQSIDEYLGQMNSPEDMAISEKLLPEKNLSQDRIAFEQNIPKEYQELYFGNEEEVGFLTQQRKQAEEEIKILERREKLDAKNAKAQASLLVEKNKLEMDVEQHKIEENRMAAKNYMTGQLAKLGALNTTGKAPEALATLEQKYQQQAQQLRTTYDLSNKEIEMKLDESVGNFALERDNDILKIKGDLSKSEEDVWKEILNLQNAADRKTFDEVEKYTTNFRKEKDKYVEDARKLAEKDTKERQRIMEKYNPNAFLAQFGMSDNRPSEIRARASAARAAANFANKGKGGGGGIAGLNASQKNTAIITGLQTKADILRFTAMPAAFKQWFIDQASKTGTVSPKTGKTLSNVYEQWKGKQANTSKSSSSNGSSLGGVADDFDKI